MIKVNPIFVDEILTPLIGGADSEDSLDTFGQYNSNIEKDVKELAQLFLLPEFNKKKQIIQEITKNTLAYYLSNSQKIDFESIFDSLLIPLETPHNVVLFFQWIWEVLFPNQSKEYIKNEIVIEDFDINAPILLSRE